MNPSVKIKIENAKIKSLYKFTNDTKEYFHIKIYFNGENCLRIPITSEDYERILKLRKSRITVEGNMEVVNGSGQLITSKLKLNRITALEKDCYIKSPCPLD